MAYSSTTSFAQLGRFAVGLLCCSACDIDIPNNVFHCKEDLDCPGGWVCDERRCRESGRDVGTSTHGVTPDGNAGRSGGAAGAPVVDDSGPAEAEKACSRENERSCASDSRDTPLQCKLGRWVAGRRCDSDWVCSSSQGPNQGKCQPVPGPCRGKEPGSPVCDGAVRAVCSDDLLALESRESCDEHAHCTEADDAVSCTCDQGYARDDSGMCQNVDDCPADACSPGGRCIDGVDAYSCVCDKGYEGSGSKTCTDRDDCKSNPCGAFTAGCVDGLDTYTCTCLPGYTNTDPTTCSNVNECKEVNACSLSPAYPCRDADPFYYCEGQFLSTQMPDPTIGAAKMSLQSIDGGTVLDNVTLLRWQRELPAVYPKCTGTGSVVGDSCKWQEARTYCEELVLGGFTEWRLPSKIELESLLDLTRVGTAIPPAFPALPATGPLGFWTSAAYSLEADKYWYVHFGEGWSYFGHLEFEPARVRCVR